MEAIKLSVGFREWSKLSDFVEIINGEEDIFAYQIDATTALIVANCPGARFRAEDRAAVWFDDQYTETIKK